ncbi:Uncharacterised protein [uncultured Clostridium sp.]|uniref:hypothetical protein n=1 Tax=uncultured Clostridium sp. TaxID=59620 RepID=UPI000821175A|nr:hypothetical protein [uncultured Clostridium sp.]SCJ60058.1 Uncharacterised protein [uncultured Clostridium sp.]
MKREVRLNNVIFPIWMMWIFPPLALLALVGNFVIDSVVILVSFAVFKVMKSTGLSIGQLYKKSILKVWVFGFLADIIGAVMLFVIMLACENNNELVSAICYNPFNNIIGFLIVVAAVLLAVVLIWIFNYYIVFNKLIQDSKVRIKIALTIAIVTMPWTYLIPTQWVYNGF